MIAKIIKGRIEQECFIIQIPFEMTAPPENGERIKCESIADYQFMTSLTFDVF